MGGSVDAREQSIISMYRSGVSLRTLQVAFGMSDLQIIDVLRAHGVVEPDPGEGEAQFVDRIRHDVKHAAA
jgi:hypothetical protein